MRQFDANVLNREPLELFFAHGSYRPKTQFDILVSMLSADINSSDYHMSISDAEIRALVNVNDKWNKPSIELLYPMKSTHLTQLLKQGKDHPVAKLLAVQRLLVSKSVPNEVSFNLTILNMSYDPKRRPNKELFLHPKIEIYSPEETFELIKSHIDFDITKQPAKCKNLDWYKDGGRNRRIKCELCPFNEQCKYFDTNYDAMQKILSF